MNIQDNKNIDKEVNIENKALNIINKFIDSKKLQMNLLWTNKIVQEEFFTLKPLKSQYNNKLLLDEIFRSIANFSDKINKILEKIQNKTDPNDNNVNSDLKLLLLLCKNLQVKITKFSDIKHKQYKVEKEKLCYLLKTELMFNKILEVLNESDESLSIFLREFLVSIEDFNKNIQLYHV